MYVGMSETRSLKMLLKHFHENYGDLSIKSRRYITPIHYKGIYSGLNPRDMDSEKMYNLHFNFPLSSLCGQ